MNDLKWNIKVIFENENLLVIDKPSGISMHKDGKKEEYTIADWILDSYPEIRLVGEPWEDQKGNLMPRPGIVHRLDKDTSGIVLIAKEQDYYLFLKNKFQAREIQKEYRAFVYGSFLEDKLTGTINKPIGRSKKFGVFTTHNPRGKVRDAVTEYRVILQSSEYKDKNKNLAYLALFPKTGRTHQLRVHLKSINRPIICDKLYAPKKKPALGFSRLALHAYKITFLDRDGTHLEFTANLPQDFLLALDKMKEKQCEEMNM